MGLDRFSCKVSVAIPNMYEAASWNCPPMVHAYSSERGHLPPCMYIRAYACKRQSEDWRPSIAHACVAPQATAARGHACTANRTDLCDAETVAHRRTRTWLQTGPALSTQVILTRELHTALPHSGCNTVLATHTVVVLAHAFASTCLRGVHSRWRSSCAWLLGRPRHHSEIQPKARS
jgi:hypothetical protein